MSFEVRIRGGNSNKILAEVCMEAVPAVGEIVSFKHRGDDSRTSHIVRAHEWTVKDCVGFNNKKYDVTIVDLFVE